MFFDATTAHPDLTILGTPSTVIADNNAFWRTARCVKGRTTGKWYFEIKVLATGADESHGLVGLCGASQQLDHHIGRDDQGWGVQTSDASSGGDAQIRHDNSTVIASGFPRIEAGHTVMFAVDLDAERLWVGSEGAWWDGGDPEAGTSPTVNVTGIGETFPGVSCFSGSTSDPGKFEAKLSASQFAYAAPDGFTAWAPDDLASRILDSEPIAYYKLDETSGTTAADSSGNDNHGTISGGVILGAEPLAWSDGASRAMVFDGSTGSLDANTVADLTGQWAVLMVCDASAANVGTFGRFFSNEDPVTGGGGAGLYWVDSSTLRFRSNNGPGTSIDLNAGRDLTSRNFMLALINDGANLSLAIDGEVVDTVTPAPGIDASDESLVIADRPNLDRPNAIKVDDFAFFEAAITSADAFALAERVVQKTYRDTVLALSPTAYYRMDEASGATATDESSNSNEGSYSGSPTLGQAALIEGEGNSVLFDGADDALIAPSIAAYQSITSITMGAWISITDLSSNRNLMHLGDHVIANDQGVWLRVKPDGSLHLQTYSNSSFKGVTGDAGDVTASTPAFVVATFDEATQDVSFFVDGTLTHQENLGQPLGTTVYPLHVGVLKSTNLVDWFAGVIDEPALFDRPLTPAQISALHYRGTTAAEALQLAGTAIKAGVPVARLIRAHRQSDGSLIGETTSSAADGSWSIPLAAEAPCYVVAAGDGEEAHLVKGGIFSA